MAETTYTKKIDGKVFERVASTPAEHVELEFNGWVAKTDKSSNAGDSKSTSK